MLECKFSTDFKETYRADGINRYMLECKLVFNQKGSDLPEELIDTCWNVNN